MIDVTCTECTTTFQARNKAARYCSKECRGKGERARRRIYPDPISLRSCEVCGEDFQPKKKSDILCSAKCRRKRTADRVSAKLPDRKCEVCETVFKPYKGNQKFCSRECGALDDGDRDSRARVNADVVRTDLKELRERQRDEEALDRRIELITAQLETFKPRPYKTIKGVKPDPADSRWILHLSDWHIGQKTDKEMTGDLYYHNHEVARAQLEHMITVQRELIEDRGREIRQILIVVNGDMLENDDMRPSQLTETEMMASEQFVHVFDRLRWTIDAQHDLVVEDIVVSIVGGNHDRTTRKAGNAGLGEAGFKQTYAWMLGELLTRWYVDDTRVRVINWPTWYGHLTFAGKRIVHTHGSDIRWSSGSYGGVPWYPIVNAARNYTQMLGEYDLILIAHGHIAAILPLRGGAIIGLNGSLPGTSHYIQSTFKTVERPLQQLFAINKHGMVGYYPLYLDVGQMTKREAIWGDAPIVL